MAYFPGMGGISTAIWLSKNSNAREVARVGGGGGLGGVVEASI